MKFATFFMGEYANMIIVSAINATLFWGGYHGPLPWLDGSYLAQHYVHGAAGQAVEAILSVGWITVKILCGLYFFIWVRATMPRLRYDMLMRFGWQGLLPISLFTILLIAVGITYGYVPAVIAWAFVALIGLVWFARTKPAMKFAENTRRGRSIALHASAVPYRGTPEDTGRGGQTVPPQARIGGEPVFETDHARAEANGTRGDAAHEDEALKS
jgi:NADH-quinone oxidoreductase subunit H